MSFSLSDLHALPDDELIRLHDDHAKHTEVGVDYYLDEYHRRQTVAAMKSSQRLATAAMGLSVVSTVAAVIALFVR